MSTDNTDQSGWRIYKTSLVPRPCGSSLGTRL